MGEPYNVCEFRAAPLAFLSAGLGETLALAREANGDTLAALSAGLHRKAPRFQIEEDKAAREPLVPGGRVSCRWGRRCDSRRRCSGS